MKKGDQIEWANIVIVFYDIESASALFYVDRFRFAAAAAVVES